MLQVAANWSRKNRKLQNGIIEDYVKLSVILVSNQTEYNQGKDKHLHRPTPSNTLKKGGTAPPGVSHPYSRWLCPQRVASSPHQLPPPPCERLHMTQKQANRWSTKFGFTCDLYLCRANRRPSSPAATSDWTEPPLQRGGKGSE